MTANTIIAATYETLKPLLAAEGGEADMAASLQEAQAFLDAAPPRWRALFVWPGYGSHPAAREGMTTHRMTVVVQAPRGLSGNRGAAGKDFEAIAEKVSALVRALRYPDGWGMDAAGWGLDSSEWVSAHANTRAHAFTFTVQGALPVLTEPITVTIPT